MSATKATLVYFPFHGRAMPARLAAAIGNIDYDNEYVTADTWAQEKPKAPTGTVPYARVGDRFVSSSNGILSYFAALAGIAPTDAFDQAAVADALDAVEEIFGTFSASWSEPDQAKKEKARQDALAGKAGTWLASLNKRLEGKKFWLGDKISAADLKIFAFVFLIAGGTFDGVSKDYFEVNHPNIDSLYKNVLANEAVAKHSATHLAQVQAIAPFFFAWLVTAIATAEVGRAKIGWEEPTEAIKKNMEVEGKTWLSKLNDDYYPGDIGFDPLGLKPTDPTEFAEMQTKELNNGRLAMFAAMGMIVQEQITGKPLLETLF